MRFPIKNAGYVCASLLVTAFLCGCTTVGGPRAQEAQGIQQNHQTIVLARVICMDDVQGQKRPTCDFTLNSWQLTDRNGQIEIAPPHTQIFQRSLSKPLREQGWFYTVMNPGSYCLMLTPYADGVSESVGFYLSIPTNQQFVYAGTIVFDRGTEKRGKKDESTLTINGVSDESELAKTTSGSELANFGEMTPQLLISYDNPPLSFDHAIHVESSPADRRATPTVKGDNLFSATIIEAPGIVLLAGASGGSGDGAAYAAAAGLTYMVAAAPLALASWEITAHAHRKKWAPYEAALQKQVTAFHLGEKLQQSLASRMSVTGTNSTGVPALWLEAQPYRILLRGDEHQKFNLELAARVRLLDPADHSIVWEHNYVYSCPSSNQLDGNASETILSPASGQHKLEDFRGDAGAQLMQNELASAVDAISDACVAAVLYGNM